MNCVGITFHSMKARKSTKWHAVKSFMIVLALRSKGYGIPIDLLTDLIITIGR